MGDMTILLQSNVNLIALEFLHFNSNNSNNKNYFISVVLFHVKLAQLC